MDTLNRLGMQSRLATTTAVLWALLALIACDKREPARAAPLASNVETREWRTPGCDAEERCTSVVIKREVFAERPALNDAVRVQLLEQLQGNGEAPGSTASNFEQVAKAFIADAAEASEISSAAWQLTGDAKKLALHDNLLTVAISSYIYSGGAHGMPVTHWLNWDLAENRQVALADVIAPGAEERFWSLAQTAHKQWMEAQEVDVDFRENWPFVRSDDFRLTDSGLKLLYGVYTLAPYSMGEIELTLPREKLTGLLREPYLSEPEN
ncbi:DUF3298 domain-containing protein [Microbulbifer harenosus]|uniref:DUF3298 and DUF4163 domain-containing protein n=1 Tax=Microbulbifer harenosus TaxID=2576840 RepID=A0ABY2UPN2_9GAMM|nr:MULTISPECIES: DUF3298 and DUF4163 domain-containing protein [Microbulbifer]QIL90353.1 DUF3298 domain-containing protein [Microbulbifer sp. SH-1]TLM78192.1 DUF3298 and DUF4163 domain-containing protein [Microbulbifer harenosus]